MKENENTNKAEQFLIFESEHTNRNIRRDFWVKDLLNYLPKTPVCAEIGVSVGVNSKRIIDILKPEKFYLIDPWDHEHDNPNHPRHKYMKEFVYHKFNDEPCVEIVEDYSYNAFSDFSDEMFDFVYIDGLHDYKSVYEDLTCVFPKVKSGGVIAGHDYWEDHGVIPAVNEFIKTKNIKTFSPPINISLMEESGCDGNSDFFFIKA